MKVIINKYVKNMDFSIFNIREVKRIIKTNIKIIQFIILVLVQTNCFSKILNSFNLYLIIDYCFKTLFFKNITANVSSSKKLNFFTN